MPNCLLLTSACRGTPALKSVEAHSLRVGPRSGKLTLITNFGHTFRSTDPNIALVQLKFIEYLNHKVEFQPLNDAGENNVMRKRKGSSRMSLHLTSTLLTPNPETELFVVRPFNGQICIKEAVLKENTLLPEGFQ
ncbi:UNVERIFIED_CONTAM: hypothetical protein NCL1_42525 [Trichonephila clavipes]